MAPSQIPDIRRALRLVCIWTMLLWATTAVQQLWYCTDPDQFVRGFMRPYHAVISWSLVVLMFSGVGLGGARFVFVRLQRNRLTSLAILFSALHSVTALCVIASGLDPLPLEGSLRINWSDLPGVFLGPQLTLARIISLWLLTPAWLLLCILHHARAGASDAGIC